MFLSNRVKGAIAFLISLKGPFAISLKNPGLNVIQQVIIMITAIRPLRSACIYNNCKFNFMRLKRYALYCYIL